MTYFKDEEADVHEEVYKTPISSRYRDECSLIGSLAHKALNAPKNVIKQAGKDYGSWIDLVALFCEEIDEFEAEMTEYENRCFESSTRAKEELGDIAACLVLLLDWINSREDK